ncbi:TPA: 23S rRNA methyltransferase attenuation leader peptide [Streptococcus pneumoniae]|nr:23S rRNA methyltransferase attenuation leader peptide [Streptococcus pneumoniae]
MALQTKNSDYADK